LSVTEVSTIKQRTNRGRMEENTAQKREENGGAESWICRKNGEQMGEGMIYNSLDTKGTCGRRETRGQRGMCLQEMRKATAGKNWGRKLQRCTVMKGTRNA
jgi:hypothetical protein